MLLCEFSQGTGLQAQSVFKEKLTFRPHSTSSQTHRKMTLSIADRASKAQKIRVLPAAGMDPEAQRSELIKVSTSVINKLLCLLPRLIGEQNG